MSVIEIRRQLKKGRGAAGKGKRSSPPLHIGLAGALLIGTHSIKVSNHSVSRRQRP